MVYRTPFDLRISVTDLGEDRTWYGIDESSHGFFFSTVEMDGDSMTLRYSMRSRKDRERERRLEGM